jgi:hypothetical protein
MINLSAGIKTKKPGRARRGGRWDNPSSQVYGFRVYYGKPPQPIDVWIEKPIGNDTFSDDKDYITQHDAQALARAVKLLFKESFLHCTAGQSASKLRHEVKVIKKTTYYQEHAELIDKVLADLIATYGPRIERLGKTLRPSGPTAQRPTDSLDNGLPHIPTEDIHDRPPTPDPNPPPFDPSPIFDLNKRLLHEIKQLNTKVDRLEGKLDAFLY